MSHTRVQPAFKNVTCHRGASLLFEHCRDFQEVASPPSFILPIRIWVRFAPKQTDTLYKPDGRTPLFAPLVSLGVLHLCTHAYLNSGTLGHFQNRFFSRHRLCVTRNVTKSAMSNRAAFWCRPRDRTASRAVFCVHCWARLTS